jgi:lysozyme
MRITQGVALSFLVDDVIKCEKTIKNLVEVPLTQGQFDALIDFTFNLGVYNLANSTLLKLINQGQMEEADREFYRWNKAAGKVLNGLVKRRAAEAALFNV